MALTPESSSGSIEEAAASVAGVGAGGTSTTTTTTTTDSSSSSLATSIVTDKDKLVKQQQQQEEKNGTTTRRSCQTAAVVDDDGAPTTTQEDENENATEKTRDDDTKEEEEEEKKDDKSAAPKKDYSNWPLKDIREPHAHDVMFGRGGGTNHHPGNKRYRKMVEDRKVDYINSKRLDKPLVALGIIKEWRSQEPPGRFLKIDEKTGLWHDVGDKKAREKTSQALREKAPVIRKQQEEEERARVRREKGLPEESDEETTEPLKAAAPNRPKPVMARDTTFGVEYIDPDQTVTLDGFSWQEGIGDSQRVKSGGVPPPPPQQYPPGSREGSYSSGAPPPPPPPHYRYGSNGMPPPPGSGFSTPTASTDERHYQYAAHGRFESWGSNAPPPPPGYLRPQGSWSGCREHSLGQFALPHASVGHPASYATFDPRAVSGPYSPHHSPPPPPHYPPTYSYSGGPAQPPPQPYPPRAPSYGPPPPAASPAPRPPYSIDPSVASTWSGQPEGEIIKTLSGEEAEKSSPALHRPILGVKPDIVKRATSNQNENVETKPDLIGGAVKRAALNRDSSNAANRLKQLCFPDQFQNGKFDVAKEVHELSEDMGRSTLGVEPPVPAPAERVSTMDFLPTIQGSVSDDSAPPIAKPGQLEERMTTMDAIAASLQEEDGLVGLGERVESLGPVELPKPGTWGFNDRLTTTDLMQMVNEPIPDDDPELISGRRQAL